MRTHVKHTFETVRGICKGCEYGHIRRTADGDTTGYCTVRKAPIRREVILCTDFEDRDRGKATMIERGWIITRSKGRIGFLQPGSKEHRAEQYKTVFPGD